MAEKAESQRLSTIAVSCGAARSKEFKKTDGFFPGASALCGRPVEAAGCRCEYAGTPRVPPGVGCIL